MSDHGSNKGFWSLICDSETVSPKSSSGINTMLEILKKLPEKHPELFPKAPKAMKLATKLRELDNLLVFTADGSDEEVKKSAEAIRSNVDYPFMMYYLRKKIPGAKQERMAYRCTADGELYKFGNEENSAGSLWTLVGEKAKPAFTSGELLPSQVTDKNCIHLPANEEDFKKAISVKGGKWIVHCSDWETLDTLWKNLTRLYDTGVLVGLKSCTAGFAVTEIAPEYHTKAIMCYTADADCKSCVKRAAQCIFICTGYDFDMYYKSNEASLCGLYRHEGFKVVSKYMFTRGKMFERDYLGRWEKMNEENKEKHKLIREEHVDDLKQTIL